MTKITLTRKEVNQWVNTAIDNFSADTHKKNYLSHYCSDNLFGGYREYLCHGELKNTINKESQLVFSMAPWCKNTSYKKPSDEFLYSYYTWLLKQSPFRFAFYGTSVEMAMTKGFITKAQLPNGYHLAAITAARMVYDYIGVINIDNAPTAWLKVIETGVHPSLAFFTMTSVKMGKFTKDIKCSQHGVMKFSTKDYTGEFCRGFGIKTIKKFLNAKSVNDFSKESTVFGIFGKDSVDNSFNKAWYCFITKQYEAGRDTSDPYLVKEFWLDYLKDEEECLKFIL